jgi:hypothetical protein
MELEQRKQLVILVPNKVSSTHPLRGVVPSPESRAQLANTRETTVAKRMASGYAAGDMGKIAIKLDRNAPKGLRIYKLRRQLIYWPWQLRITLN